jgi:uncharacterized protein (DUF58 family)
MAPPTRADAVSPALLAQITHFELTSRMIAQGAVAGMHRSKQRGSSIAFAEHKLYAPGDDVRHLDWHAYAKTDKFHIKQFEDETNLALQLWIDTSGSMGFGDGVRLQKMAYAQQLAGALAYLALSQGDAAGLVSFAAHAADELPPRQGMAHFVDIATQLFAATPKGPTTLSQTLGQMAQRAQKRQQIVICTDLFDPSESLYPNLASLAARKHDVAVLHILDPAELSFDFEAPATFASMEDERRVFIHPRSIKSSYIAQMQTFLHTTAQKMAQTKVRYVRVLTDQAPSDVLADYLGRVNPR